MPKINEVILKENNAWLHFTEPQRIIQADTLDDVLPALHEIEKLIDHYQWHAAGFISYETAPAFDKALITRPLTTLSSTQGEFPYLWFGLYHAPHAFSLPGPAFSRAAISWSSTTDRDMFDAAIEQIKNHIARGLTYQVNYTMRLQSEFKIASWDFFLHLVQSQNDQAAYVDTGRYVICSASPELFFQLDGDTITCRPMKGTIRRGRTTLEDQHQAQALKDSEKNRAENVMIVDMIRNDLGRVAQVGSVKVPELFTVEKYPTLWQMTSTVQATTKATPTEIFSALFPCASITGAPKASTMKIISELETTPRRIYTGTIGHMTPDRKATFNVAIRTALIDRETQTAEYGVGSGIVWDSTSTDEYSESLLKARVLIDPTPVFSLLETLLWTPEGGFFLMDKHISRLIDSADYFNFAIDPRWSGSLKDISRPPVKREIIETYLHEISSQFTIPQRVRLLLDKNGKFSSESVPFKSSDYRLTMKVHLAGKPIQSRNIFLFHKTTHREAYDFVSKDFLDYDDILLYNEHDELTEFTLGNLVFEMGGRLYTPPISSGLLAGVFRAHLLETGQIKEKILRVNDLNKCEKILLINSVREWQNTKVELF